MRAAVRTFSRYSPGILLDSSHCQYPHRLHAWQQRQKRSDRAGRENDSLQLQADNSTFFGYTYEDTSMKITDGPLIGSTFQLVAGMYFCLPWGAEINGGEGFAVEQLNFHGLFQIGGPVERLGRLKYIDGCSDTLIVPPVKKGDACLNHLHFPSNIKQTQHTHPSERLGMVIRGSGRCVAVDESNQRIELDLYPGLLFNIAANGVHAFETDEHNSMDVIAFHPDSDFGCEDTNHPMINRTVVDGISASQLPQYQTTTIS